MNADLDAAGRVLRDGVRDGQWPGAVAAVGTGADTLGTWVLGHAERRTGRPRPMAADTIFDLDALTMVLATAPAVLLLADRGLVELEDPACLWLRGIDPRVTVRHLLTHTGGLPAHADLRADVSSPADLVTRATATPVAAEPGTAVGFSALGFVALGGLVESATGHGLDQVVREWVLERLGSGARFRLPGAWRDRYAALEVGADRPLAGRVHDANAAAAHGAVGHAGLFGTLADVRACLPLWWAGGPLLGERTRAEALRDQTAGLGGHRTLGWAARGDRHDILSAGWGPRALSHTGATGTSIALDPDTRRWAIVLTNALDSPPTVAARRRFHAALVGD